MINVGRFNRRIRICAWFDTENEIGQSINRLEPIRTVWAEIHPLKGKEYIEAQMLETKNTYRITCRYFKGLTQEMYILYDGDEFGKLELAITSVVDVDMKHKFYEIYCLEKKHKEQKKWSK